MTRPRRIVACATCGQQRLHQARGQCPHCYQNDPSMVHRCAEKLAAQLDPEPQWWAGFGGFLAERAAVTRAVSMLHRLATTLARLPGASPTAVLEAVRNPGPAVGELARALEAYFVESGLALALDTTAQAAADRRARRITEVPAGFRPLAAAFDTHQLQSRQRARRAGTNPRSDRTLEINLATVRDLARYLTTHRPGVTDWTLVGTGDVEAFLASITNPSNRARHLHALQGFFRFARQHRHILADPTRRQKANSNIGFHGQALEPARQRELSADGPPTPRTCILMSPSSACSDCCTAPRPPSCDRYASTTSTSPPPPPPLAAGHIPPRWIRPPPPRCSGACVIATARSAPGPGCWLTKRARPSASRSPSTTSP